MIKGIIRYWEKFPLKWKGIVLAVLPFVVLALSASVALWGNRQRERTETALAHHIALANSLEDVQFLVVSAETGTRGFLLTRRDEFLAPFRRAGRELPRQRKELETIVASEPGDEPRREKMASLKRIEALVDGQMKALLVLQRQTSTSPSELLPRLQQSKRDMDALRAELRLMRRSEEKLMNQRMKDIIWVRQRDYIGVAITLFVGVLARALWIYLFNTGINGRLERIRENVLARERGEALPHDAAPTADALGELEREIVALSPRAPDAPSLRL
jgi:CHASE3 domain sensor protein